MEIPVLTVFPFPRTEMGDAIKHLHFITVLAENIDILLLDCVNHAFDPHTALPHGLVYLQQPENAACNRCHYTGHTRDALFQNVPSAVARMVSMLAERKSSTALQYENKTSVKALNQSDPFPILGGANSDANRGDDQDVGTTDQGNAEPDDSNC